MIELEKKHYHLVSDPLKKIKINTLFARAVVEKKVSGKIYVDHPSKPESFYVVHPYGMSLLFGNSKNTEFNQQFKAYALNENQERKTFDWMQTTEEWHQILKDLFADKMIPSSEKQDAPEHCIEMNTRVNFIFDKKRYENFKQEHLSKRFTIQPTDKKTYAEMKGSVIPDHFWDNAEDFCKHGVGFSLFEKESLATTAYSAFIFENELELGMETLPEHRGKGYAQHACAALIDYCLENNYEPIWACKQENIPSHKLAQKLGFVPHITLPYYRLAL